MITLITQSIGQKACNRYGTRSFFFLFKKVGCGGGGGGGRGGGGSVVRGRKMFNDFSHIFSMFLSDKTKNY